MIWYASIIAKQMLYGKKSVRMSIFSCSMQNTLLTRIPLLLLWKSLFRTQMGMVYMEMEDIKEIFRKCRF